MQITLKPQLLAEEAALYEKIKSGRSVSQIIKASSITKNQIMWFVRKLIDSGMVLRTGTKRHYVYTAIDRDYEIVAMRKRLPAEQLDGEDVFLQQAASVGLGPEQLEIISRFRETLPRTELAKRVGITKLELNFILARN